MQIRLLLATSDASSQELLCSLLHSAQALVSIDITSAVASTLSALEERVVDRRDDVILLDWNMAEAGTPDLVRKLLAHNGQLRIVALLPNRYRQYRQLVWSAGACTSIPKEHLEQEWLASVLCVMHRAMEREARILDRIAA
jgi:DNA-binding NarL/FixJ family response regulator